MKVIKTTNGKRPMVNPHASALVQDAQLRAQQRYDKATQSRRA